jgi:3-methyladenine DNA glycosylase AlkD
MLVNEICNRLQKLANPQTAIIQQRFFKTAPGEYGEGDIFIGIKVPVLKTLAKEYTNISVDEAEKLLQSEIHEERSLALHFWVKLYQKKNPDQKELIYQRYLQNTDWINNWDLVDATAPHIVGDFLFQRDRKILYRLAKSGSLWERRISIIATQFFIRKNDFADTLKIAAMLLNDREDLMHKACGWMLREVGERDLHPLEEFLEKYYQRMPRTMLRYSIEKFPEAKRKSWLNRK